MPTLAHSSSFSSHTKSHSSPSLIVAYVNYSDREADDCAMRDVGTSLVHAAHVACGKSTVTIRFFSDFLRL